MGRLCSDDLRERAVAAIEAGHTRKEVAELYNIALSAVCGFIKRKRETASVRSYAARLGVDLDCSTLAGWVGSAC
jgi:transposase